MTEEENTSKNRPNPRILITFSMETRKWLEDNHLANGYATVSKFVSAIITQRMDSERKESQESKPMTPEEERDNLVDQMGAIRVGVGYNKISAIASLVPKGYPHPESDEEVSKIVDIVWKQILDKNGCVTVNNKRIVILKAEVREWENP